MVSELNIEGDKNRAKEHIGKAQNLLYRVKNLRDLGKLDQLQKSLILPDGTIIRVASVFNNDIINISSPWSPARGVEEEEIPEIFKGVPCYVRYDNSEKKIFFDFLYTDGNKRFYIDLSPLSLDVKINSSYPNILGVVEDYPTVGVLLYVNSSYVFNALSFEIRGALPKGGTTYSYGGNLYTKCNYRALLRSGASVFTAADIVAPPLSISYKPVSVNISANVYYSQDVIRAKSICVWCIDPRLRPTIYNTKWQVFGCGAPTYRTTTDIVGHTYIIYSWDQGFVLDSKGMNFTLADVFQRGGDSLSLYWMNYYNYGWDVATNNEMDFGTYYYRGPMNILEAAPVLSFNGILYDWMVGASVCKTNEGYWPWFKYLQARAIRIKENIHYTLTDQTWTDAFIAVGYYGGRHIGGGIPNRCSMRIGAYSDAALSNFSNLNCYWINGIFYGPNDTIPTNLMDSKKYPFGRASRELAYAKNRIRLPAMPVVNSYSYEHGGTDSSVQKSANYKDLQFIFSEGPLDASNVRTDFGIMRL